MKPLLYYTAVLTVLILANSSCNPDCKSLVNVGLKTPLNASGNQIQIIAEPLSDLEGRKVFFGNVEDKSAHFKENVGLIATIPPGLTGNVEVKLEDPDCLDVVSLALRVEDANFFVDNLDYVPPSPPEIIIPVVPITFPSNVDNAWLSPNNPGYCLWFTMYKDTVNGVPHVLNLIDPDKSFEQATCCCLRDSDLPYAQNRMGGIVDNVNNRIEIYIDRRPRGGKLEEFVGYFIDRAQTNYANNTGKLNCPIGDCINSMGVISPCEKNNVSPPAVENRMMYLTSKTTGMQIVVYQLVL